MTVNISAAAIRPVVILAENILGYEGIQVRQFLISPTNIPISPSLEDQMLVLLLYDLAPPANQTNINLFQQLSSSDFVFAQ
jgi:hypothetical protein